MPLTRARRTSTSALPVRRPAWVAMARKWRTLYLATRSEQTLSAAMARSLAASQSRPVRLPSLAQAHDARGGIHDPEAAVLIAALVFAFVRLRGGDQQAAIVGP